MQWPNPLLLVDLKAILINFYDGNKPSVDVDNMSKPILDVMQQVVYDDDRQIGHADLVNAFPARTLQHLGQSAQAVRRAHDSNRFGTVR